MAKIIYAIQGEGMGHATRSKAVIEKLNHDVTIIGSSKVCNYFGKGYRTFQVESLHIGYTNNRVNTIKTFLINISRIFSHLKSLLGVIRFLSSEKPDLIITDFEYLSCWAGLLLGIPIVSVDNVHMISRYKISVDAKDYWSYLKSRMVICFITPKCDKYVISSFFQPMAKNKAEIIGPLIREKVVKLKPKKNKHILVYQTSSSSKRLLPSLRKIDEKFIVYGFGKRENEKNIDFKEFNEKSFFDDLRSCRAVIMNGSFSLMTEALYLGKPVLAVPVKKQFEQVMNADYLQRRGYGMKADEFDEKVIRNFLQSDLKRCDVKPGNEEVVKKIENYLRSLKTF